MESDPIQCKVRVAASEVSADHARFLAKRKFHSMLCLIDCCSCERLAHSLIGYYTEPTERSSSI